MDLTTALAAVDEATVAIGTIGGAIVVAAAIAFGWRWVKAMFF